MAKPLGLLKAADLLEGKGVLAGGHHVTGSSRGKTIKTSGRRPEASLIIADMEVDEVGDPGGNNVVWMCLGNSLPTGGRTGELSVHQGCHGCGMGAFADRRPPTTTL